MSFNDPLTSTNVFMQAVNLLSVTLPICALENVGADPLLLN